MSTTATPKVSVVVTCWNLGAYLPETIDSIRAQTFADYEICVVDDGSTDAATLEVLAALPDDIARVTTGNNGLSAARNAGVRATAGEYVCAVDADDILHPSLLEQSVRRLDERPDLAFVSHWLRAFGDESWEWRPERCDVTSLLDVNTVNGSALVRRSVLESVGGWDETMRDGGEDWEFWIRVVAAGHNGTIIPDVLFGYRRRADSMSRLRFAGEGHARVYRSIVERHQALFLKHWPALAARREADLAGHHADIDALEERIELELQPAVQRARDDLRAARLHAERVDREVILRAEHAQLKATASALERDNADLRDRLEQSGHALGDAASRTQAGEAAEQRLQDEVDSLSRAHAHAVHAIDALHASWSWRLTAPMRALGRLALQLRERR